MQSARGVSSSDVSNRDSLLTTTVPTVAHNLGSETKKAAGIPLYMVIGQCGAILGSHLYPLTEGPRYMCALLASLLFFRSDSQTIRTGFSVNCALEILAAVIALVLTVSPQAALSGQVEDVDAFWPQASYRLENRRRDRIHGKVDLDAVVDTTELADKVNSMSIADEILRLRLSALPSGC